jgi:hypothetical protein
VTGIGLLIFDFVLGRVWGIAVAGVLVVLIAVLWVLVPRRLRATSRPTR